MSDQSKARVLIVDNDPRVGEDLLAMLQPLGYHVEIAQGIGRGLLEQAKAIAHRFRPHVAVVDLRLLDEFRDERSGFELLESLKSIRHILYSAYLTPEVIREAVKKYEAAGWVGKSESPQQLLDAIADAVRESCAYSRHFSIQLPSIWTADHIIQTLFPDDTTLPLDIVDDVLSQLFPGHRGVMLEMIGGEIITASQASRGRSVALKAWPDDLQPVVVKLAPARIIQKEGERYREYVKDRLIGRFYAQLERPIEFWELGGAVYSFLGSSLKTLPSFSTFYRMETDSRVILKPLRHFFTEIWSGYYAQPLPNGRISLFQMYDEALHLKERLESFSNQEKTRAYPGLPVRLINPVPWVLRHADDSLIPGARQAITHGDLHGDNLFVDGEHAWAIDFERTGPGHILRDLAELEVDIVTRIVLLPAYQLYELAVTLAEPGEPKKPVRPTAHLRADTETRKALHVVSGLRKLAYEATHYLDSREYLWALLLDSLFVATLVSEDNPQRDRALLLGSVLCGRLRHWGKEWPPKDFPQIMANRENLQPLDKAAHDKGAGIMSGSLEMSPTKREKMRQEDLLSLQLQLAKARENLRIIQERKAEFVLSTDIPPQLVKEERRLLERIVALEQQLAQAASLGGLNMHPDDEERA
jgi:CheY-like chemotaxis protein